MTCKDCIHYEVCLYHITEETEMTVSECTNFKDKSKFIELPNGYKREAFIGYEENEHYQFSVNRIVNYTEKWLCATKEEAEAKVKELNERLE